MRDEKERLKGVIATSAEAAKDKHSVVN